MSVLLSRLYSGKSIRPTDLRWATPLLSGRCEILRVSSSENRTLLARIRRARNEKIRGRQSGGIHRSVERNVLSTKIVFAIILSLETKEEDYLSKVFMGLITRTDGFLEYFFERKEKSINSILIGNSLSNTFKELSRIIIIMVTNTYLLRNGEINKIVHGGTVSHRPK